MHIPGQVTGVRGIPVKKRDDLNRFETDQAVGEKRTCSVGVARFFPALLVSLLMLATSGCQLFEARESGQGPPRVPRTEAEPAGADVEPLPPTNLATAMAYLEAGRGRDARAVLAELARDAPGSRVLVSLLRQIDEPPESVLPGPYRPIEVGPGESLSLIAARELGDPLLFYALARLNEIEVPARVPAGSVLRVPESAQRQADSEEPSVRPAEVQSEVTVTDIESVAEFLSLSGQRSQAHAMLVGRIAEGNGVESTRALLRRLTLEHAAELRAAGAFESAVGVIDEALAVMDGSSQRAALVEMRSKIRSEMLRQEALRLRDGDDLVGAYRMAQEAADLDAAPAEATLLEADLREEVVASMHNRALVAWRDRNVDLAIRSWEALLAVVPDFEPAQVYLARARRLRERLDQP